MNPPKTIFKYEPFALRAIQNLKASSVHFGPPSNFNDPYDCALTASIADTSHDELEQLRTEALTSTAYPQQARDAIPDLTLEEFETQIRRGAQLALDQIRDDFLQTSGVTCFSETNNNLLMWSHYGGKYKGFCLEFFTDFEPFNKLQKVHYANKLPQFQLSDFIRNENHAKLMDLFCTKSSAWAYEKEWRALHNEAGTLFSYEREALKAIYFGPDINTQDRDLLCLIMNGQFPDAELWIGSRSSAAFIIEFEKAPNYLPYAEARRRGLA
ncbi:DUF2971 domain-containing protein [Blastopirellula sp. J2-11]|uniref:DUF2971 domain-containing protein n=1 Tax=Blastopirellula sp. J2-11 TaxID=2943192 RepID=UPI0021C96B5C|nr:DUF2971 domain-containing protein [Blastopirellula sp. J2-11]UUO08236.1 DUF2971 domain-containing protein [Blastopirellula sp. J2-11]